MVRTEEYVDWAPIDEQMGLHERIRLLYVACTRARDHLVVSVHRKTRANEPEPKRRTNAELLVAGMVRRSRAWRRRWGDRWDPGGTRGGANASTTFDEWAAERSAALLLASRPTTVSATALTDQGEPDRETEPDSEEEQDPGLRKRPRDLDLPPWLKGRYGTAVGRAVHGVLQTIDLATGAGLDEALAAQCEAEAIPDRVEDVRMLVQLALESPSVLEAASSPHWREIYACTPVEGRLLEGYIDLLYRGPRG